MRPLYRAGQFFRAFRRRDPVAILAAARPHLSPQQMALFGQMSLYDQEHAVEVLGQLRRAGETAPELMQVVLLHDVGKAFVKSSLWRRVAHVLVRAVRAEADSAGYADHAEIGARMAEQAGSAPTVCALIRQHHDALPQPPTSELERWLAALQRADETV